MGETMITVGRTRLSVSALLAMSQEEYGWRTVACGARVWIGRRVEIGPDCQLGPDCRIDDGVVLGPRVEIGPGCQIVSCARIAADCQIGSDSVLGLGVEIGPRVVIGPDCQLIARVRIGSGPVTVHPRERDYTPVTYRSPSGERRIASGCRDFDFSEARAHWGSPDYPDRARGDAYLAILDAEESRP